MSAEPAWRGPSQEVPSNGRHTLLFPDILPQRILPRWTSRTLTFFVVVGLLVSAIAISGSHVGDSHSAYADEDLGPIYMKIIKKPKVSKKGKSWLVEFTGQGNKIPNGTKVRVLFTWRSKPFS